MDLTIAPNSPDARDRTCALHPYTNARAHEKRGPIIIDCGKGIHVVDDQGNRYFEALAGLWSVAIGYGEERVVAAAAEQMRRVPYCHSFLKANNLSIDIAERLGAMTPERVTRAFFANSGSEASETVVKLVWYYNSTKHLTTPGAGRKRTSKSSARSRTRM